MDYDATIIGAGAAGLTAARELLRAGMRVCCLEARDRVGGRICTVHDPQSPVPIELGTEFVHGRPAEILELWGIWKLLVASRRAFIVRVGEGNNILALATGNIGLPFASGRER